ncbi:50S ribosomal protein L29 [Chitinivibrio alkaliphilus]|uniref:Large ribosomal subunit protein uL29 n=1 Tax=Chitinivibrio alkaliphilus ACht1 TaxID=1313304 RepID=U7D890_9BACT|nr:50S ribosomal protein L29 [Chitinivibrio alkaliphilus]ERP31297.1 50S ribosomal protein L29 [Chitinivibrio alkaliphilus ACht1]
MKSEELRGLSVDSLEEKIGELEDEYFQLRFKKEMGQLENPLQLREKRRVIARAKTILTEKSNA